MITKEKNPIRVLFLRDHGNTARGASVQVSARPALPGMPGISNFIWLEGTPRLSLRRPRST